MKQSKINNYIRRVILCVLFVAILMVVLVLSARLVERKDSVEKNGTFFAEAEAGRVDGLLIGSSHVINGINPAQIYEETGYTVYNLAGHGSILPVSYWTLVNALDYCTPRYVFIDTYMLEKDYQYLDINVEGDDHDTASAVDQLHEVLDCFPNTANKRAAIRDLILDADTQREFLVDFIKYHSRWSEITENDYKEAIQPQSTSLMGAEMRYEVTEQVSHYDLLAADDMDETDSVGKQYLRRIIELCLSRGITPVIIQVPFEASEDHQRTANSAAQIAGEYGIPFVNMRYVADIINDYSDLQSQTHVSAYGAYKVTHYFAEHTLRELAMIDHRGEAGYEAWETSVQDWHQEILDAAAHPRDLYAALMTLQFEDVSSEIYVNADSAAFANELVARELMDLQSEAYDAQVILYAADSVPIRENQYVEGDVEIDVYRRADGELLAHLVYTNNGFMVE